jgi:hypothetical protein
MVEQAATERLSLVGKSDKFVVVWWGTLVEVSAAIERRYRGGGVTDQQRDEADARLAMAASRWITVGPSVSIRGEAVRQARVHGLRAGDAFQLAAARMWAKGEPSGHVVVTLDHELRGAAVREGFTVLPE